MDTKIFYDLMITETTNLGAGVARDVDGRAIFVDGAVEGDVCDAILTKNFASYSLCNLNKLHTSSPFRATPDCPAFGEKCGGCTFRHISYEHELSVKEKHVRSLFKRAGLNVTVSPIRTAGKDAVRTKVTVPVSRDGEIGYYKKNSHSIIPQKDCRLHDRLTNAIIADVSVLVKKYRPQGLHHLCIRRGTDGLMVIFISEREEDISFAKNASLLLSAEHSKIKSFYFCCQKRDSQNSDYTLVFGDERIKDRLAGCDFLISPDAFYQVNHGSAEILYTLAREYAALRDGDTVADLYCGTGTIGISVIKNSAVKASLTGIEIVASAVEDAKANAKANGIEASFICGDAASFEKNADCVIVDPPRAGCDKRLISHLMKTSPPRIVYISCDPATLVRDLKILSEIYHIEKVTPVDMFPRTGHVETVALLSRKDVRERIKFDVNPEDLIG